MVLSFMPSWSLPLDVIVLSSPAHPSSPRSSPLRPLAQAQTRQMGAALRDRDNAHTQASHLSVSVVCKAGWLIFSFVHFLCVRSDSVWQGACTFPCLQDPHACPGRR